MLQSKRSFFSRLIDDYAQWCMAQDVNTLKLINQNPLPWGNATSGLTRKDKNFHWKDYKAGVLNRNSWNWKLRGVGRKNQI